MSTHHPDTTQPVESFSTPFECFEYFEGDQDDSGNGAPSSYTIDLDDLPEVTPIGSPFSDSFFFRTPDGTSVTTGEATPDMCFRRAADYLALGHALTSHEAAQHDEEVQALATAWSSMQPPPLTLHFADAPQLFKMLHAAGFRAPEVQA